MGRRESPRPSPACYHSGAVGEPESMAVMNILRRVRRAMRPEWTVLTAAVLLPFGLARAQGTAANGTAKPRMMAQDANPDWEVATVRPSNPDDANGQRIRFRGRYVMLLDHTVEDI